ncbi:phytoene desaturase family protein [Rhodococcus sp. TAF43]|uniref:phytoene desaturase family protein n=1 Tax=unclassified Rhodococcus (in: high G+C Gram-positive bacteria) TaxID=192944 RepID=UPI00158294C0|nr:phytoene desaturase family protein [Rhodococcus sp. W8901]QKT14185.1 phytoene desaturase [Rhodococcus sp. W8901]
MAVGVRTVPGATDRVVVVGAGLAGLAAALHLRGRGRDVTLLERDDRPGGRVGTYRGPGYVIDSGATVLTMPELVRDALAAVGADFDTTTPPLRLHRLAPAYHARFADGSTIDVHSDPERMVAEVARVCGPDEARRYLDLRRWLARVFDAEFDTFIDANFDSPLDLFSTRKSATDLARLLAAGGFGRLGGQVARRVTDPRLQRIFTFQALYAGVAPAKALAVYGAIAHMDTSLGVSFPEGGMCTIAESMADAFTSAGGTLHLGTEVTRIERSGDRVRTVHTADGRSFPCDALVLTPDLPIVDDLLATRRVRRQRISPSAVVLHGTVPRVTSTRWGAPHHHTIDFGAEWERTFAEIAARPGRGRLMSDPSLLITRPAVTDPGLILNRDGVEHEPLSVLAPCPNLDSAPLDWSALTDAYASELLQTLEQRGYHDIGTDYAVDHIDTPATWARQGMAAGSPFAPAHIFRQTGPFRRRNLVRRPANVVLAGSGTTPGVGVPTVLISGKLAAERVCGRPKPVLAR